MDKSRLSPTERMRLIENILGEFLQMDWWDVDTMLVGFGLTSLGYPSEHSSDDNMLTIRSSVLGATDATLIELSKYLKVEAVDGRASTYEDLWTLGFVRIFFSHLASQKVFVSAVAEHLDSYGLHGFVAHESIEPDRAWQGEIERALRSADAIVGLVHPGFGASCWTQQEVGWAYGQRLPMMMIRLGEDPKGFPASIQSRSMRDETPVAVADAIARWVSQRPGLGERVGDALIASLAKARTYYEGRDGFLRVEALGRLTDVQLDQLQAVYLANNQLYGSIWVNDIAARVFPANGRAVPDRHAANS